MYNLDKQPYDIDIGFAVLEYGNLLHVPSIVPWTWRTIVASVEPLQNLKEF